MSSALQNGYRQLFVQFFERFPIPLAATVDSSECAELDELVLNASSIGLADEMRIDSLICQLYNLSDLEQEAINSWKNLHQSVETAVDDNGAQD
jgi:hypothetical protein